MTVSPDVQAHGCGTGAVDAVTDDVAEWQEPPAVIAGFSTRHSIEAFASSPIHGPGRNFRRHFPVAQYDIMPLTVPWSLMDGVAEPSEAFAGAAVPP